MQQNGWQGQILGHFAPCAGILILAFIIQHFSFLFIGILVHFSISGERVNFPLFN